MKKILLIGCGHMGNALLTAWINSKQYSITVIDPIKYIFLKNKYKSKKIKILKSIANLENNIKFDFIIFAIKPIDLNNVIDALPQIKKNNKTSIVSVIAGKKINIFEKKFTFI